MTLKYPFQCQTNMGSRGRALLILNLCTKCKRVWISYTKTESWNSFRRHPKFSLPFWL